VVVTVLVGAPFGLTVFLTRDHFEPPLDDSAPPTGGRVDLSATPESWSTELTAAGEVAMNELVVDGCAGAIPRAPTLMLHAAEPRSVRLTTESEGDPFLALRTADGEWWCDDDSGGDREPMIASVLPAGDHRVHVGTYGTGDRTPVVFRLHHGPTDRDPDALGVDPDADPTAGSVSLAPGDPPPPRLTGETDAWLGASQLEPTCRGFVPAAPHAAISVAEATHVVVTATSPTGTDLTLLLRTPEREWLCDDDSGGGLVPRVGAVVPPGRTVAWVGVYRAEDRSTFEVEIARGSK